LKREQCGPTTRHQQRARGLTVESVNKFKKARLGPVPPQCLDHAQRDAAATVDCHPGGFVEHQKIVILVDDGGSRTPRRTRAAPPGIGRTRFAIRRGRRHADGRNPNPVARQKPSIRICATAIDPHLTASDQAVDMRFGDTATKPNQEIVESLAVVIFINGHHRGGRRGGGGVWA